MKKTVGRAICAACGGRIKGEALRLTEVDAAHDICSFECLIEFAVERIRVRREHHNRMLRELRKRKDAG